MFKLIKRFWEGLVDFVGRTMAILLAIFVIGLAGLAFGRVAPSAVEVAVKLGVAFAIPIFICVAAGLVIWAVNKR